MYVCMCVCVCVCVTVVGTESSDTNCTHDANDDSRAIQIGPVWINSPLVLQERYDTTIKQYVYINVQ